MPFNVGDKVRLRNKPNGSEVTGVVEVVSPPGPYSSKSIKVKYDGQMIPPADWHFQSELEHIIPDPPEETSEHKDTALHEFFYGTSKEIKCECGLDSLTIGGKHSTYCPKFSN